MAFDVRIPSLGESVNEGVIARWLKQDGETVARDDILLELETDKASMELPAESAGVLRILKQEGETVAVGDVVARIEEGTAGAAVDAPADGEESGGDTRRARSQAAGRPAPRREAAAPVASKPTRERAPKAEAVQARPAEAASGGRAAQGGAGGGAAGHGDLPLSPAVRHLVEAHDLDPAAITATGKGGRLTKSDVLAHVERVEERSEPASATVPAGREGEERVAMSRFRKRIAERLVEAQRTAAILTTFNEIDMSAVMALRARHREQFEKTHGVGLGFMSFFARACIAALAEIPAVNAEISGDEVIYRRFVNLGVAVGTERGLVVPVVHHAECMSFAEIEREIGRLAGLAHEGKLTIEDLSAGTFTISNGGVYGSLLSTPILNPPQSGILGMHKIEKRPVVVGDEIVIRPMMYVALSYDHRLVDGEQAVTFLVRVKERLEDPARLLLEV